MWLCTYKDISYSHDVSYLCNSYCSGLEIRNVHDTLPQGYITPQKNYYWFDHNESLWIYVKSKKWDSCLVLLSVHRKRVIHRKRGKGGSRVIDQRANGSTYSLYSYKLKRNWLLYKSKVFSHFISALDYYV